MRQKREIVLVGAALLAGAYGVYTLVFAPARSAGAPANGLASHVSAATSVAVREIERIQRELVRSSVSPLARLAVARAGEEWNSTLFVLSPLPGELADREAERKRQQEQTQEGLRQAEAGRETLAQQERLRIAELQRRFSYTGFVKSADRLYAVINGATYAVGESLEDASDCCVERITPDAVTIADKRRAVTVEVPIRQGPEAGPAE